MRKAWVGLSLISIVAMFASCVSLRTYVPGAAYPSQLPIEQLKRNEYVLMGAVTGEGCAHYVGLWPIPIFWVSSDDNKAYTNRRLYSPWMTRLATEAASYEALKKIPDADILLEPRVEATDYETGPWYARVCVRVTAKAVHIKTDEELKKETTVAAEAKPTPRTMPPVSPASSAGGLGPAGEVWTDPATGLMWQNGATVGATGYTLADAQTYCAGLSLGGYSDWRLPTLSELRSLLRGCPATATGGSCDATDSCLDSICANSPCKGCDHYFGGPGPGGAYWPPEITGALKWYWSSSPAAWAGSLWVVNFAYGEIHASAGGPSSLDGARCVRAAAVPRK